MCQADLGIVNDVDRGGKRLSPYSQLKKFLGTGAFIDLVEALLQDERAKLNG